MLFRAFIPSFSHDAKPVSKSGLKINQIEAGNW